MKVAEAENQKKLKKTKKEAKKNAKIRTRGTSESAGRYLAVRRHFPGLLPLLRCGAPVGVVPGNVPSP